MWSKFLYLNINIMSTWLNTIANKKDVSDFCNNLRMAYWLEPKEHKSNFIFESKVVENAHVMKRAMTDIFRELEILIEIPLKTK